MVIDLGLVSFPTKTAATAHFSKMLRANQAGDVISGDDAAHLQALLDRHPDRDEKIGCGVAEFFVMRHAQYNDIGFGVRRVDGSVVDFSFLECLRRTPHRSKVLLAMRRAVADDIIAFRRAVFSSATVVPCALTGADVTPSTSHVDHVAPTFLEIAEAWRAGRPWESIAVEDDPGGIGDLLADEADRESFRSYHQRVAVLRVVTAHANLSRPRGAR
jgi:hypothetical protein